MEQSLKQETQAIQSDSARYAELRMELIEDMNGLGPIREPRIKASVYLAQECTCDRDPLANCKRHPCQVMDDTWNAILGDCLAEPMQAPVDDSEPPIADYDEEGRAVYA